MTLSAPHRRQLECRFCLLPGEKPIPSAQIVSTVKQRRWNCAFILARWKLARLQWLGAFVACLALLGFSLPASASLGGNVSTVETDRAQMNAHVQVKQRDSYEAHEIAMPGGTVVDEYVSADGTVFAVSWHGQFPPPMQQILGTYFQQYSAALETQSSTQPRMYGHRPLNIQQPGLVVETSGHMRAHAGRAYIPGLLPQGITVNQIQ
jgi:hypothetical protein